MTHRLPVISISGAVPMSKCICLLPFKRLTSNLFFVLFYANAVIYIIGDTMVLALKKQSRAVAGLLIAASAAIMTVYAQESRSGAVQGITMCLQTLVPSLFPFMAVTQLLVRSGVCSRASRFLHRPTRALFGISGSFAPVFLLCMIGGYPVGAAGIRELYSNNELNLKEARRAALFAVGAGPGFLLSFTGISVYGNWHVGFVLLIAQTTSAVALGIMTRIFCGTAESSNTVNKNAPSPPLGAALTESVYGATRAMAVMAGFVVLFSAVQSILNGLIHWQTLKTTLTLTLEVCGAVTVLAREHPVEMTAFAVGFGGICVHCQILAVLGDIGVNKALFFLYRIFQGILTALFTHLLLRFTPLCAPVFSTAVPQNATPYNGSILSGIMLVAVSVAFLFSCRKTSQYK